MGSPGKMSLALVAACLFAAVPGVVRAQNISIDGRFSQAKTLNAVGGNYPITPDLGKQVGGNLFHSFGKFGLDATEKATFSGPSGTQNVIGRVTGGAQSNINGQIVSAISGANLYLINPSGIVFGPTATVNVSGSFYASTANYLRMSDGAKFQATNPDASTLTMASPVAFGFITATPAKIAVNGSALAAANGSALGPGTLGLVAGPVSISGSTPPRANLSAPAGTIHVTAVAGTGEVPINPRDTSALTVTSFGQVNVSAGSILSASTPPGPGSGGSVFIHSGALTIDASTVAANNTGSGPGRGQLVLRGDTQVTLRNGASVQALTQGSGSGAEVTISTAPSGIVVVDASTVSAFTMSSAANAGPGGTISILAGELALHNSANVLAASCITLTCSRAEATKGAGGGVAVSLSGP